MKKAILILCILLSSCVTTIKSPATHIEYTGEISERGLSITALPPFWKWCVQGYKYLVGE
jgi:hypothetical protein